MSFDDQEFNQTEGETSQQDPFVNLKVVGSNNIEMTFKIKRTKPLQKLMEVFSERNGLAVDSLRFLYDGNRIRNEDTPESLDMESGDSIDAMVTQTGGCLTI